MFTAVAAYDRQGNLLKRKEVGVTPMTVSITRKDGVVELEKEGYQLTRVPMRRGMNPWFLGNVVLTSMLSSSIDSSTGAINEYDPDEYLVELPREDVLEPGSGTFADQSGDGSDEGMEPYVPDVRPLAPAPKPPVGN